MGNIILLLVIAGGALLVMAAVTTLAGRDSLNGIKSRTVGDGQYGTARWATDREVKTTYAHVPFRAAAWRTGKDRPTAQGLILGSVGDRKCLTALVDRDDVHCLMIGASGVGKTAFFLYPNLEYACASGMSFLALDTKGDLARNYITDPQKTDDALLVSSFGCAASDAAAKEFEWTRNLAAQRGMQIPKVIARHLIQSFDIGEVSPEQAHEIGKQFADEWLKGKYEYVIATHIDKGHCHNHIIFNAVNFVDFHSYRSNKRTYRELRQLSDEICKEHGLSVIPPSQGKGMD